jgi:hypothetical protein
MEQRQDGLQGRPILVALLADHIRMGLDSELMRDQAGMRKRFFSAL